MKSLAVFLFILGVALARGDATADKVNQLETKNIHQVIKPSTLEAAGTRNADLQISHMQYQQGNRMDNQEMGYQQHSSQLQSNAQSHAQSEATTQFYRQNQAPPPHGFNQDLSQQFHRQNEAPAFHSQGQAQLPQQFHHPSQTTSRSPGHPSDQEMPSLLQQSQQRMSPTAITSVQSHQSNEQSHDFSSQQLYSDPQQEFYQDRRSGMDVQDRMDENRRFSDASDRQSPVISSAFHSAAEMRTGGGFPPQVFPQRSAFDNRQQPIILPGVRQTHSTSVVVSGMKNLPALPALVYSAGAVPATHAVAYGRPLFHGGAAYVKQHWQTPYARYVYSHIL